MKVQVLILPRGSCFMSKNYLLLEHLSRNIEGAVEPRPNYYQGAPPLTIIKVLVDHPLFSNFAIHNKPSLKLSLHNQSGNLRDHFITISSSNTCSINQIINCNQKKNTLLVQLNHFNCLFSFCSV